MRTLNANNSAEALVGQRREREAEAKAQERVRLVNGQNLAKTLLKINEYLGPEIRDDLLKASEGYLSVSEMDAVLSRARDALLPIASLDLAPEQKAVAGRLARQEKGSSFEAWKAKFDQTESRLRDVYKHLVEIDALGVCTETVELEEQLRLVTSMEDTAERSMGLDTLTIAVNKAKSGALSKSRLLNEAGFLAAELSTLAKESETLDKFRSVHSELSLDQLEAVNRLGRDELARLQDIASASARRKVVLEGLQKLGYQVQEGLANIASDAGRLVARSPTNPEYGVELTNGKNHRIQVRSVAFDSKREITEDVAEERRWCSDFSRLKADLQKSGCEVVIEKALGVGAAPVPFVDINEQRDKIQSASTFRSNRR